jgi:hypothetical protein
MEGNHFLIIQVNIKVKVLKTVHDTCALAGANLSSSNTFEILFIKVLFPDPLGPTSMRHVVSGTS